MPKQDIAESMIRLPTKDELGEISSIFVQSMAKLLENHYSSEKIAKVAANIPEWKLDFWLKKSNENTGYLRVAEKDSEIEGFVYSHIKNIAPEKLGWIDALFILPDSQNAGVGTKLFEQCKDFFKSHGADESALTTYGANVTSSSLYRKHGMAPKTFLWNFDLEHLKIPSRFSKMDYELIELAELCSMDKEMTGYDRSDILTAILSNEDAVGIKLDGGYSVVIKGGTIGPVGATTEKEMKDLIYLSRMLGGITVRVPDNLPTATGILKHEGYALPDIELRSSGGYRFPKFYCPCGMHG